MKLGNIFTFFTLALFLLFAGCRTKKTVPTQTTFKLITIEGYQGDQHLGKPHGYGKMSYQDANHSFSSYEGSWQYGTPSGHGTIVYRNGDRYVGAIARGQKEGYGVLYYSDGAKFEGRWEADLPQGYGIFIDQQVKYTGNWRGYQLNFANVSFANGDNYEGDLDSFYRQHGKGKMCYANGSVYEGNWKEGEYDGQGKLIATNGRVLIGLWRDGKYRGEQLYHSNKRVYGIDISRHQHYRNSAIEWNKLQIVQLGKYHDENANHALPLPVSFVIVKATEGRNYINPFYAKDFADAKKHNIPRGAYHFFNDAPVDLQVNNFIKTVKLSKGDFPPVLDLEPNKRQIAAMGGEMKMLQRALLWLKKIEKHYGVRPIIYLGQHFATDILLKHAEKEFEGYDLWVARYSSYSPSIDRIMWQIDDTGRVTGIMGSVDINMFNGSIVQLREYIQQNGVK